MASRISALTTASTLSPTRIDCLAADLMRAHALYRVIASGHLGNDGVVIVGVEPSAVANLPAGFGVEGRVIENDLAGVSGLEFLRALIAFDDGKNFAVIGASLAIAFEFRFRKLLIRRISCLLGRAFPGSASAFALLAKCGFKTFRIKTNPLIPRCIFNEVPRQTECLVEIESLCTRESGMPVLLKCSNNSASPSKTTT